MMAALLAQVMANPLLASGLLVIGILFICAWLLMRLRRRGLQGPGFPTARENLERYRQKDAIRDDLERLMVDIEQLAKRLGAQLDAKSMRIEKLVDDADLRIAQLQQVLRDQHATPPRAAEFGDNAASPPVHRSATESAGAKLSAPPAAGPLTSSLDTPSALADAGPSVDPLAREVHRLADQGMSAPEIARQTTEHVGKVELILALRDA